MKPTRHILVLLALLIAGVSPLWAQDAQLDGLHCGDIVVLTATPDPGYRFVRWSDGNMDNPREIEISDAVNLTAIYEPLCQSDPVPVAWLYGQLLMVDVDSLQQMGYTFSEQDVTWYRIVGDIDVTSGENDDQLQANGYYYVHPDPDVSQYYVTVDVSAAPPAGKTLCTDLLYGHYGPPNKNARPGESANIDIMLLPNFGVPGTMMHLTGLSPSQNYTIQIYDAVGRQLENHTSIGAESYTIVAQPVPGYYVVRVSSPEQKTALRYIVQQ